MASRKNTGSEIKGEPLAWNQETEFNLKEAKPFDNVDPTKKFTMDQLFDWSSAPIRRIDEIRVGANSHRTANIVLLPNPAFIETPTPTAGRQSPTECPSPGGCWGWRTGGAAASGAGLRAWQAEPGAWQAEPIGGMAGMGGATGMTGGQTGSGAHSGPPPVTEPNKLARNRYLYVTEQCRHTPVGIVMVVEQEHIHDILVKLADSKLRFRISQLQFNHLHGVKSEQPGVSAEDVKPNGPNGPNGPKGPKGPKGVRPASPWQRGPWAQGPRLRRPRAMSRIWCS